jgi:FlaA1/EpsC-like NDP-sugar epimerase
VTALPGASWRSKEILESHPVAAVENNTLGTAILAKTAERCGVERFVLVST